MPLKHTVHDGHLLISISGGLTIFQASERKPELLHALTSAQQRIVLDLAGVDEIDTAGVQLLLLLLREVRSHGRELDIAAYSPAVLSVFDLLQLHGLFGAAGADTVAEDAA
jgi:anti-sigma B factor antagonist